MRSQYLQDPNYYKNGLQFTVIIKGRTEQTLADAGGTFVQRSAPFASTSHSRREEQRAAQTGTNRDSTLQPFITD
ncbi:hypothetical protein AOLI_G00002100 [Acnodon oligacanthus]